MFRFEHALKLRVNLNEMKWKKREEEKKAGKRKQMKNKDRKKKTNLHKITIVKSIWILMVYSSFFIWLSIIFSGVCVWVRVIRGLN